MMEHPAAVPRLGVSGKFTPVNQQVVAPGQLRPDSQSLQKEAHGLGKKGVVIELLPRAVRADDGEVDVSEVVKNRAPARQPADDRDFPVLDICGVDFLGGILILSHNNRPVVAPQHDHVIGNLF